MTVMDRAPSIDERYATALQSSRLAVAERVRGDADLLIAAGWVRDSLATTLYRLAAEYDLARGGHDLARRNLAAASAALAKAKPGPAREAALAAYSDAEHRARTARAMLLVQLKTLPRAKRDVAAWALLRATVRRFAGGHEAILALAGQALDTFLDPLCRKCHGSKHVRTADLRIVACRGCKGTGNRRVMLGRNAHEHEFAGHLLSRMDWMRAGTAERMRRFLRLT